MQPRFSALSAFEFPELHDESIPTTNFFRHLTKLMLICGVRDFNLNVSRGACPLRNSEQASWKRQADGFTPQQ